MKALDFFKPTWKKAGWLILVFLMAEMYTQIVAPAVPNAVLAQFIAFVLHPIELIITQAHGIEKEIAQPFAKTIDLVWMYLISVILAKEVSKDKE
jgi:hypothetical protein